VKLDSATALTFLFTASSLDSFAPSAGISATWLFAVGAVAGVFAAAIMAADVVIAGEASFFASWMLVGVLNLLKMLDNVNVSFS